MDVFVVFALATQMLLVAFFAAHLWRPTLEMGLGRFVYATGIVALLLALGMALDGRAWYLVFASVLYAVWTAFGAMVDAVRPISWRRPARWSILVPYTVLFIASLFALWIPLWYVDIAYWLAFGALYGIHTALNLYGHVLPRGTRPTLR